METITCVDLDLPAIRRVVEQEGGCLVWGGAVRLSPADDILIRVERALELDGEGQLVASVLSKKAAAGATHLVLDLPVGPTAKVRTTADAERLAGHLLAVAEDLGIKARALMSDGRQPVGRGIGPALEARDVLAVLRNERHAPVALRARAVQVASAVLELGGAAAEGAGTALAEATLQSGEAWRKFQAICKAQGGMREPPRAAYTHVVTADRRGRVTVIDNRRLARVAKLAGAPDDKAAGVEMRVSLDDMVDRGEPLFTLHAESPGEIAYALNYAASRSDIILVE
jgi:thymidine phosphorylase